MSSRPAPQIDHYMGHEVVRIEEDDDGWYIEFDNGARIHSTDPDYPMPDNVIVGQALRKQVASSTETRLYFGPDNNPLATVMSINPMFALSDPEYNGGELVTPNFPDELQEADSPFEVAPGERVVDGPDEEFLRQQEAAQEDEEPEGAPEGD
jgi:hypothetical protein